MVTQRDRFSQEIVNNFNTNFFIKNITYLLFLLNILLFKGLLYHF